MFTAFDNDNSGADTITLAALNRAGTEVNSQTITNTDGGASAKMAARGYVVMNSDKAFSYAMTQASGTDFSSASSSYRGISDIDISTEVGATEAKETIASARQMITNARTEIGGVINRLKFAEDYNQGQRLALTAARGNIIDADFAKESAALARSTRFRRLALGREPSPRRLRVMAGVLQSRPGASPKGCRISRSSRRFCPRS